MDFLGAASDIIDWCDLQGSVIASRGVPEPVHYMVDDFLPTLAKIMVAVPYALRESFQKAAGRTLGAGISSDFGLNINLHVLLAAVLIIALLMVVVMPHWRR